MGCSQANTIVKGPPEAKARKVNISFQENLNFEFISKSNEEKVDNLSRKN